MTLVMGCSILCTSRQVTSLLTRPYNIIILKKGDIIIWF
ncbi:hypothetical protein QU9_2844 [Clostridioides difficile P48]|nr:hypothetical protein QCY_2781 [Clostridioides difficile CD70]EQI16488.1 hypothetical protein QOK_2971 [Clostridioides difficile Y41]EQI45157.1 hypothetical protein QQ1_2770 [Clostridioides difficile Y247]EQJ45358.1 hypothetical protein QSE_3050 [Clostridioides difficile P24]EQJ80522.1 hypothetical protein QU9_2844 [Clostridioides difficile P48]EQJ88931.1 hypothetical protein QUA_2823 [Clostridioides difficile P49]EQK02874.1 hypothetical protein QUI_2951 [Clostridioides difficile P59]